MPDFSEKIVAYKEETKMRYVTIFERMGIEKGLQQEAYKLLVRLLKKRFGVLPEWTAEKMQNALLKNWKTALNVFYR